MTPTSPRSWWQNTSPKRKIWGAHLRAEIADDVLSMLTCVRTTSNWINSYTWGFGRKYSKHPSSLCEVEWRCSSSSFRHKCYVIYAINPFPLITAWYWRQWWSVVRLGNRDQINLFRDNLKIIAHRKPTFVKNLVRCAPKTRFLLNYFTRLSYFF